MKKVTTLLFAALILTFSVSATSALAGTEQAQKKCPVMGYKVNKKLYADHNGKRVYFCCASCDAEFKKDPDKYIKKLEAQGVVLDKTP